MGASHCMFISHRNQFFILIPVELRPESSPVEPSNLLSTAEAVRTPLTPRPWGGENGTKQWSTTHTWLVAWNIWIIFPYIGNFIIPTDELHHFSEGLTNSKRLHDCGKSLFSIGRSTISTGPFSSSQTVNVYQTTTHMLMVCTKKNRVNLEMVYGFTKNLT